MNGTVIAVACLVLFIVVWIIVGILYCYNRKHRKKPSSNSDFTSKELLLGDGKCGINFTIELSPEGYSVTKQSDTSPKRNFSGHSYAYLKVPRTEAKRLESVSKYCQGKHNGHRKIGTQTRYHGVKGEHDDDEISMDTDVEDGHLNALEDRRYSKAYINGKRKLVYEGVLIASQITTPVKKHLTTIHPSRHVRRHSYKKRDPQQSPADSEGYDKKDGIQEIADRKRKRFKATVQSLIKMNQMKPKIRQNIGDKTSLVPKNPRKLNDGGKAESTDRFSLSRISDCDSAKSFTGQRPERCKSVKEIVEDIKKMSNSPAENNTKIKLKSDHTDHVNTIDSEATRDTQHTRQDLVSALHNQNASGKTRSQDMIQAEDPQGRHAMGAIVRHDHPDYVSDSPVYSRLLRRDTLSDPHIKDQRRTGAMIGSTSRGQQQKVYGQKTTTCTHTHNNKYVHQSSTANEPKKMRIETRAVNITPKPLTHEENLISSSQGIPDISKKSMTERLPTHPEKKPLHKTQQTVGPLTGTSSPKQNDRFSVFKADTIDTNAPPLCPALPSINTVYSTTNTMSLPHTVKPVSCMILASPTFTSTSDNIVCHTVSSVPAVLVSPLSSMSPLAPKPPPSLKPQKLVRPSPRERQPMSSNISDSVASLASDMCKPAQVPCVHKSPQISPTLIKPSPVKAHMAEAHSCRSPIVPMFSGGTLSNSTKTSPVRAKVPCSADENKIQTVDNKVKRSTLDIRPLPAIQTDNANIQEPDCGDDLINVENLVVKSMRHVIFTSPVSEQHLISPPPSSDDHTLPIPSRESLLVDTHDGTSVSLTENGPFDTSNHNTDNRTQAVTNLEDMPMFDLPDVDDIPSAPPESNTKTTTSPDEPLSTDQLPNTTIQEVKDITDPSENPDMHTDVDDIPIIPPESNTKTTASPDVSLSTDQLPNTTMLVKEMADPSENPDMSTDVDDIPSAPLKSNTNTTALSDAPLSTDQLPDTTIEELKELTDTDIVNKCDSESYIPTESLNKFPEGNGYKPTRDISSTEIYEFKPEGCSTPSHSVTSISDELLADSDAVVRNLLAEIEKGLQMDPYTCMSSKCKDESEAEFHANDSSITPKDDGCYDAVERLKSDVKLKTE